MLGCNIGILFKVTVGGGSYQEGMTTHIQGVPPGMLITEEEIYSDLLLRKPGQDELTSPRMEPDIPVIYSGINVADTMLGVKNAGYTNGTPFVILIPNLDRKFEHIEQYRKTNRTPRPGHASYASFQKYGIYDDAIGAGFFSGRCTSTVVAAGTVAKKILKEHGIEVIAYIKEAAGVSMKNMPIDEIKKKVSSFRKMRKEYDKIYKAIYTSERIKPAMRFLEKMAVLSEFEKFLTEVEPIKMNEEKIRKEYGIHPKLNCPDLRAADEMYKEIIRVKDEGDSTGGVVEVVATGLPAGMGEPFFNKLSGELGRLLNINAVKAVEIGAGTKVKDMRGSQCNDELFSEGGKVHPVRDKTSGMSVGCLRQPISNGVKFKSNNAGGITGGLTTGQPVIVSITIKPTPTIAKDQNTIDKLTLQNVTLKAVTRRDPTIVPRAWPVAEAFAAIIILDQYMQHLAYQSMFKRK